MRGGVVSIVHVRGCCGNIGPHPASVGASATFPQRGKALPKRLLPSGEAAARRRLMRGGVISIVHVRSCCGNIAPHPASVGASATFPLAGEGSPQKASPPGRSCRPQAADEGQCYLYCPFMGLLREHRPSSGLGRSLGHLPPRGEGSPKGFSLLGEAAARRRLMRGGVSILPFYKAAASTFPSSGLRPPSPKGGRLIYYPSKSQYSAAPNRWATHRVSARPGPMSLA